MTTVEPKVAAALGASLPSAPASSFGGWAQRVEGPVNARYRTPLGAALARYLPLAAVTPSRLMLARPACVALSAYLLTFASLGALVVAACLVEARAILGCAASALHRRRGLEGPDPLAMRGVGDPVGAGLLALGVAHLVFHRVLIFAPRPVSLAIVALALAGALGALARLAWKRYRVLA